MKSSIRSKKAFILMEVMLAAGIFAIAGAGLALALNDIAKNYTQARRVNSVRIELETRMDEMRLKRLVSQKISDRENSGGITYTTEVTPLELTNKDRVVLPCLYRLTFTAEWLEGMSHQEEKSEIYVYQP